MFYQEFRRFGQVDEGLIPIPHALLKFEEQITPSPLLYFVFLQGMVNDQQIYD